jgi:hypothetical protein
MVQKNGKKRSDDHSNKVSSPPPLSLVDKMKYMWSNFKYTSVLCCFKLRKQTTISILKFKMLKLKENFGDEYLTLVGDNASVRYLEECLTKNLEEFYILQEEIDDVLAQIDEKVVRINRKMETMKSPQTRAGATSTTDKAPKAHPKKRIETKHKNTQKARGEISPVSSDCNDTYSTEKSTPSREPKRKPKNGQGRRKRQPSKMRVSNSERAPDENQSSRNVVSRSCNRIKVM